MAPTADFLVQLEGIPDEEMESLEEGAIRQLRRYGNKTKMQYRCQDGDKKGKLVSKPSGCGLRKDPDRVHAGRKSARIKKGQRVRKSNLTKRKTLTKDLMRKNKMFKGATANTVAKEGNNKAKSHSDNITSSGSKGTE